MGPYEDICIISGEGDLVNECTLFSGDGRSELSLYICILLYLV